MDGFKSDTTLLIDWKRLANSSTITPASEPGSAREEWVPSGTGNNGISLGDFLDTALSINQ